MFINLKKISFFKEKCCPNFLGGLISISGDVKLRKDINEGMYRKLSNPKRETVNRTFGPYYTWSNRGKSEMTIWLPVVRE